MARLALCLVLAGCTVAWAEDRATRLGLPFSDARRVGDLLILSGQLGNLPGKLELAPGGLEGEARQAMENVKAIVEAHDLTMDDVVKCTVMLQDMNDWAAFNEVYVSYFPGVKPARSAFGASGLALGGKLEIECWASFERR
jgi:reactive intermediate/imine deaminase